MRTWSFLPIRPLREPFSDLTDYEILNLKNGQWLFFFFFLVFFSFWRLNFLFCFPLIIFQGFVFTHQNDRKFSVCVSFKFGLNLIFRIRHLFFRLPPWQPSPAFLYIVIQRPLSSWPLYHNLVHPSQRTLLMTEARRCRSPWPGDFQGVIKRRK